MLTEFEVSQLSFNRSETNLALANDGLFLLLLKCPAASSTFAGAILDVCASSVGATLGGYSTVEVLETPTTSVNGTAASAISKSRINTPPTCPVTVFLNTDATAGTLLKSGFCALSQDFQSGSYVLKPATNYLVRLTNKSTAALVAAVISVELKTIPNLDYLYRVIT